MPQNARERTIEQFKSGRLNVLVATDVAARGIHVDDVEVVIHYDPASDAKTYLHRSGRTARAGGSGVVVSLICIFKKHAGHARGEGSPSSQLGHGAAGRP